MHASHKYYQHICLIGDGWPPADSACRSNTSNMLLLCGVMQQMVVVAVVQES